MSSFNNGFSDVVETIYNLPLEDKIELKNLLENNIADDRRNEIASNYKKTQVQHKEGKLKFTSNIQQLKKML